MYDEKSGEPSPENVEPALTIQNIYKEYFNKDENSHAQGLFTTSWHTVISFETHHLHFKDPKLRQYGSVFSESATKGKV